MQRGSRDERGFTMVEMIITIAIMAILAGIIGGAYSIIKSGNASKSTSRFLGKLDTTQVENMTKKGTTYLYLFKDSDGVQTLMYNDGTDTGLNSQSDVIAHKADGVVTDIAGSGVDFTATSGSDSVNSKDTSDLVIKISFDKASGAFKCCKKADDAAGSTLYKEISFKGRGTTSYGVKLVKDTGKHMQG